MTRSAIGSGCCGGPAPEGVDACCVRDAEVKAQGEEGCGCGPTRSTATDLPVVVVGAGPVGLAAAAHLALRSLPTVVLEASDEVGASVRDWGHVRLFSPWRYNVDRAAQVLLERSGWHSPPADEL